MLDFLLQRVVIAGVHIAPPCGTCSRARGIPMADGSKGPQPLRSAEHPLGIPSLNQGTNNVFFWQIKFTNFVVNMSRSFMQLESLGRSRTPLILWCGTWNILHGLFLLASLSICMHVRMDQRGRNSLPFCAAIETSTSSSFTAVDSTSIKLGELRQMELLAQPWRLNIPEHFVFDMLKFFMNCVNSGIFIHAPSWFRNPKAFSVAAAQRTEVTSITFWICFYKDNTGPTPASCGPQGMPNESTERHPRRKQTPENWSKEGEYSMHFWNLQVFYGLFKLSHKLPNSYGTHMMNWRIYRKTWCVFCFNISAGHLMLSLESVVRHWQTGQIVQKHWTTWKTSWKQTWSPTLRESWRPSACYSWDPLQLTWTGLT